MHVLADAIAVNHSLEYIDFRKCNLLQKHGMALGEAIAAKTSLKHLTLIEAGIGDLAMVEIAKGIKE